MLKKKRRPTGVRQKSPLGLRRRPKVCRLCVDKIEGVNYKDVNLLQRFVTERGKIIPRRISGSCASHQRKITRAVKQARSIALLPFVAE